MKKSLLPLFLAAIALCSSPAIGEEAPPLFSPAPPEPGAASLVETYLPLLANGEFDQALALNDLRGMRQYLLDRRLTELKTKNPELTANDIEEMSAQIQLNDLNPARLQEILRDVMKEGDFAGMTWGIRGYAPAPESVGGYLVSIDARTAEGKEKPILLGVKKLGEQWMVAPEIIEELTGRKPVVRLAPSVPTPEEATRQVNAYWQHWQAGTLNDAYALFGAEYRGRVPLLSFLQQAQNVMSKIGMPSAWNIVQSREIAPAVLGLGVNVQGSTTAMQTIMVFRKQGETWVLEDCQYRLAPEAGGTPAAPSAAPPVSRPDLRTNLKPSLGPSAPAFPAGKPLPPAGANAQ
jgi:hypothetical protein